jgi:hypothetical protein
LDRRSTLEHSIPKIQEQRCIHTKNVFPIIDLSPLDESYKKIRKHLDSCKICEHQVKVFEMKNSEVRIQVPKPQIDTDTKQMFEREVSDLFRVFDLNEKVRLKKKIKNKIKSIDSFGASFMSNLASKQMLKTYAFGAVLFIVLKQFFN